jgi:hypothetical protein
MLDIMYHRLPYVFGDALPFKSLVLYIYRPRGIMNQSSNQSTNSILLCGIRARGLEFESRQPQFITENKNNLQLTPIPCLRQKRCT